jgi:hypothetical protein
MTIKQHIYQKATGKKTNGDVLEWNLSRDVTVLENNIIYKGKIVFGEIDELSRSIFIDRRKALESKGRRNPLLSHTALVPNATYKIHDSENYHEFKTDSQGRTIKTFHRPTIIFKERLGAEQTKALQCKDEDTKTFPPEQISDEGGHILASSAGGLPETINIFPQAYCVNHSPEWRRMENKIKDAIENKCRAFLKTSFNYKDTCKRPVSYIYEISIDGNIMTFEFDNTNLTIQQITKSD